MKVRGLAVLFYLGLAPFFWCSSIRKRNTFLAFHLRQAMAVFLSLFLLVFFFVLSVGVVSLLMVDMRWFYDRFHPEPHLMSVLRKLFLCWAVFWMYAAGLAAWGSERELPVVGWLSRKPRLLLACFVAFCLLYGTVAAVLPVTLHAMSLVRQDARPGQVYMLYEDIDRFPRWMFALGLYPISRAATERWGRGSVVMLKLSREAIQRAVREGRFVFIGSHGRSTGLLLEDSYVTPEQVRAMGPSPRLQFVYLTSCDSGTQRQAWEEAFAPAKVVTYDRLTAVLEHIWWLWHEGPKVVRTIQ